MTHGAGSPPTANPAKLKAMPEVRPVRGREEATKH
jgi:hypothetical protein